MLSGGGLQCAIDLCDSGSWAQLCDTAQFGTFFSLQPTGSGSSKTGVEDPVVTYYSGTEIGTVRLETPLPGKFEKWGVASPDESGNIQNMSAYHSASGYGAFHIAYDTHLDPSPAQHKIVGPMFSGESAAARASYNFIGVL